VDAAARAGRGEQVGAGADARRHRARGGAPWWRLFRHRAAGRAVAAPRLVRGCAAAAGFAMARVASSRTILGSPRIPRTRAQGSYVLNTCKLGNVMN